MNKILITRRNGQILTAVWDGSRILEFGAEDEQVLRVGDIFLGKINAVAKNIQAAFVEVQPGVLCFLPLPDRTPRRYKTGDVIPVIVTRESVKTKDPVVSDSLTLNGRYLVLVTDRSRIAVSQKIRSRVRREELKNLLEDITAGVQSEDGGGCSPKEKNPESGTPAPDTPEAPGIGFIVRTNAEGTENDVILAEASRLIREYTGLMEKAPHRTVYSLLRPGIPSWLTSVRDARQGSVEEVLTDQEDIYRQLKEHPEVNGLFPEGSVRMYRDSYPLDKLFRVEHFLEMALNSRVWLKSGGYLVIEYTEAMTVIDVNSGKYDGHRNREETFRLINLEAAEEIAMQLRLRNLSGIILVDFIDLAEPEHREELQKALNGALAKDPQKAVLVDFTALGLAEITRKKVRRPLHETIRREPDLHRQ